MGLDWIAMYYIYIDDTDEWTTDGCYRGKGVAWDKNIENLEGYDVNDCYGDYDCIIGEQRQCMTSEQRENTINAIDKVMKMDKDDIILDGYEYDEWLDFMEGAKEFLIEHEHIFCWF